MTAHARKPLSSLLATVVIVGALALAVGVYGCGESGDPYTDGQAALGRGDHAAALTSFEKALSASKPEDAAWLAAKQGQIAALAKVDPARAQSEAIALVGSHKDALGVTGARVLAGSLLEGQAYQAAFEFLKATVAPWPVSEQLDAMYGYAEEKALAGASSDELEKLRGLGYIGDDSGSGKARNKRPGSQSPDTKSSP